VERDVSAHEDQAMQPGGVVDLRVRGSAQRSMRSSLRIVSRFRRSSIVAQRRSIPTRLLRSHDSRRDDWGDGGTGEALDSGQGYGSKEQSTDKS
jgi:hypothetical protein